MTTPDNDERERLREMFRARLNAPPPPPIEAVRSFLGICLSDADGDDEVRDCVARLARTNTRLPLQWLNGIEALLADPPPAGTLSYLVAWDGNHKLPDPSDVGAADFLRTSAELIRELLGDDAPPRRYLEDNEASP